MPELRRDPVTDRWTLIDLENSQPASAYHTRESNGRHEGICPFCPGNEYLTTQEVDSLRLVDSRPNTPGWVIRTIPNKFPALLNQSTVLNKSEGIYDVISGVGSHEVIIETPHHDKQLADISTQEMIPVVAHYQQRMRQLYQDPRFKYVLLFKNFGAPAGASVYHAHAQMVALPMVPKYVYEELKGSERFYYNKGGCIFCAMIAQEHQDKTRVVAEDEHMIAFCPFASRYPFEVWLMPKVHHHQFIDASSAIVESTARLLQEVLQQYQRVLDNPAYNFYLHTSPIHYENGEHYHWHIEIIPKLTRSIGFEWGTGLHIVPTDPAHAARELKQ